MDSVREQLMINQFIYIAGCHADQAKHFLQEAKWHFETALSMFFQDGSIVQAIHARAGNRYSICTPANTPATPPNFPEALTALSRLSATDRFSSPPDRAWTGVPPGMLNGRHDDGIGRAPADQVIGSPTAEMPSMH